MRVRNVLLSIYLTGLLTVGVLSAITWQDLPTWRVVIALLGACLVVPIFVTVLGIRLIKIVQKRLPSFEFVLTALVGTLLIGGSLTLFRLLLEPTYDLSKNLMIWILTYAMLGILYALVVRFLR